jgi:hypothetical protein
MDDMNRFFFFFLQAVILNRVRNELIAIFLLEKPRGHRIIQRRRGGAWTYQISLDAYLFKLKKQVNVLGLCVSKNAASLKENTTIADQKTSIHYWLTNCIQKFIASVKKYGFLMHLFAAFMKTKSR